MSSAYAQRITGVVVDKSDQSPVAGATVFLSANRSIGTYTDTNGFFALDVPGGAGEIIISTIGYKQLILSVNTSQRVQYRIELELDARLLEDVVVVGYGTQSRANLTGAVASVNVDRTLSGRPIADVGRGLQGSVPGLAITIRSGEIGSDPLMRIRGQVASVSGNANPLILVDNVEIPSIQIINPDDIESISVLKDAASASIYGAKAAFGVVLITTKKGAKQESVTVNYSNNFSWQNKAKELNMATVDGLAYTWDAATTRNPEVLPPLFAGNMWRVSEDGLKKAREWQQKYGSTVSANDPVVYGRDWWFDGVNKFGYRTYNAVDALVANWTPTSTHNLSVSGLTGKTSFNIGLGVLDQTGMTKPAKVDDFKRYNVSVNVSSEVNKYVSVRAGAIYSDRVKRYPSIGSVNAGDPWLYAYRWGSMFPVGVEDQFGRDLRGPSYEFANTTTSSMRNIYTNLNLGTTINITKNWDVKFDYTHVTREDITDASIPMFTAMDVWYNPTGWNDDSGNPVYVDDNGNITSEGGMRAYRFLPVTYPANGAFGGTSSISRQSTTIDDNTYNLYSTYHLSINNQHDFKFMAGMNASARNLRRHYVRKLDLTDYDNPQFSYATGAVDIGTATDVGNWASWESSAGFFGRINYAFRDKYLVEANLRYDGASKFPKHLKWQYFPSFSAGWIITNEPFMDGFREVLSFAKLRGSFGQLGDASVPSNLYIPSLPNYTTTWIGNDGTRALSYRSPDIVSSDIRWQTIQTINFGIETRFWNNKVGVEFDWYQRDTKDMIVAGDALPFTLSAAAPRGNFGNLQTRGFELTMTFQHRFKNGLGINMMANLFDAVSHVTKGPDWRTPWEDRAIGSLVNSWVSWSTGARYGDIWGYVTDRLYQESDFVKDASNPRGLKKVTIIIDGQAKQSYMLVGDNPVYQTRLEGGDGVQIFRPGDVKFVDLDGDGYITPGRGTFGDPGDRKVIGNVTPRYEYGFRLGADYKGFDFSVFIQGVGSRQLWGSGHLATPGYNSLDGAMPQAIAGDYWRPDRTDAFYPRPWDNGNADTNYSLQVQTRYLLNMAYTRIKNITLGYSIPQNILNKVMLKKTRAYVSLENFFTFDNLRGLPIDPEVVTGFSMFNATTSNNANLSRTGMGTPTFKSVSAGVQVSF
ncbi:MAG: SusC/RagA family TonB-linked outer membrane protein [Bacteroidales bacterium]|nr:SusC/RagA family TonB-linked outer membrane protein [Bacteroidales bacterium]